MKKLALSVAVSSIALAAVAAQAGTVYEKDGLSLDISGQIAFEAVSNTSTDVNAFKTDDLNLFIEPSLALESGTVFGYFDIEAASPTEFNTIDEDSGDTVETSANLLQLDDEYYLGYQTGALTVKFGNVYAASDDFWFTNELDSDVAIQIPDNISDETLKVSYAADAFTVIGSYDFSDAEDATAYAVFASYDVAGATIAGTYESIEDAETAYGVAVAYSMDAIGVAAQYSAETEGETSGIDLTASYSISSELSVAGGYGMADEVNTYYVNTWYDLGALDFYGEVYGNDADDSEIGYVFGVDLDF
ncbi:porin [Reinekea thalattae]|uniref:Porin n=1 Tax=Reinekea thalattae TaxID=2593301 RepID=A0A5C8Z6S4_9GAMM|nr:porin [Reinekea thalattae]TXR53009.1 porin [Reinekea thalattae]